MKKLCIMFLILLSFCLFGCDNGSSTKNGVTTKKISITTNNVNQYFNSHVEVYESGYGFQYRLTITPKINVKNVDLYMEVYSRVYYTYTFINTNRPIYNGQQEVIMSDTLSSTGYGSASTYKGTGTNIINCSVYAEVIYTSGTIEL